MRKGGSYVVREIGMIERVETDAPAVPENEAETPPADRPKTPAKAGRKRKEK